MRLAAGPTLGSFGWGSRRAEELFEAVYSLEQLPVHLVQGAAVLPQLAMVFHQAADAIQVGGPQRAQAGFSCLAPRQDHAGMPATARLGTMATGIPATAVQAIEGATHQGAIPEQSFDLAGIITGQLLQDLSLATDALTNRGVGLVRLAVGIGLGSHTVHHRWLITPIFGVQQNVQPNSSGKAAIVSASHTPSSFDSSTTTAAPDRASASAFTR